MRTDDNWKLIKYNVGGEETTQLFGLEADPLELNNLAWDPEHSDRLDELTQLLRDHMRDLDDPCDIDMPGWGVD